MNISTAFLSVCRHKDKLLMCNHRKNSLLRDSLQPVSNMVVSPSVYVLIQKIPDRQVRLQADWIQGYIYTLVAEVFVFPILQSPHDVALIFRTCQLHTALEFQHENGGSEHPAAWHGQMHWQGGKHPGK